MQDDSSHADLEGEGQALDALMGGFQASHAELDDLTTAYSDGGLAPLDDPDLIHADSGDYGVDEHNAPGDGYWP